MRGLFGGVAIVAIASGVLAVLIVHSPDISAQSRSTTSEIEAPRPESGAPIRWYVASQFPITLPETGTLLAQTAGRVETLSLGALRLEIREPKDIAKPLELFDAVATGATEAAFVWAATVKGRTAAFELYGGIPFGPAADEFLAWHERSGRSLRDELYHAHNVHGILCGMVAAGGSWFRPEAKRLADIDRLPVAAFGLAARTLSHLGAYPVSLAPTEIGRAYKQSKIVGAVMLTPAIDRQLMRGSGAKRYAFPSWSHNWAGLDFLVNLDTWQALPSRERQALESVCSANIAASLAASEAAQFEVLKDMVKDNVEVRRLPEPFVAALRTAWSDANEELMRQDPDYRRVWLSLAAFRDNHAMWRELAETTAP